MFGIRQNTLKAASMWFLVFEGDTYTARAGYKISCNKKLRRLQSYSDIDCPAQMEAFCEVVTRSTLLRTYIPWYSKIVQMP